VVLDREYAADVTTKGAQCTPSPQKSYGYQCVTLHRGERLDYASSVLSSALAPSVSSTTASPLEYELEVTALELPSIAIVDQGRFAAAFYACSPGD